jgi:AcrR family transcriptional regulator
LDWILAGQELLREGGIGAVKLTPLLARLEVTSGSFYHHFRDFPEYRQALADYYGGENVARVTAIVAQVEDPAERLRTFRRLALEWDIGRLDSAMRVWATSDERARAAVARLDTEFLELIRASFRDLGFSAEQARIRALLAFAAGVGRPLVFGETGGRHGDGEKVFELLIGGADARAAGSRRRIRRAR